MTSIRRQLIGSMLAAVLAAGCIAALGVYFKVRQEVGELLDYQLRQMALSLRDQALRGSFGLDIPPLAEGLDFAIQISSDDGFLVYFSQPGVRLPLKPKPGYSSLQTPDGVWRAYALRERGLTLQVAQPVPMRNRLARQVRRLRSPMAAIVSDAVRFQPGFDRLLLACRIDETEVLALRRRHIRIFPTGPEVVDVVG